MLEVRRIYTAIVEIVKEFRDFAHMVAPQLGLHIILGHNNSNQTTLFECNAKVLFEITINPHISVILNVSGMTRYYSFLSIIHIIF